MAEWILPLVGLFVGAFGREAIGWLRFRNVDAATAREHVSEADATTLNSQTNALTVNSGLLKIWMEDASTSRQKIAELQDRLGAVEDEKDAAIRKVDDLEREKCTCEAALKLLRQKYPEG